MGQPKTKAEAIDAANEAERNAAGWRMAAKAPAAYYTTARAAAHTAQKMDAKAASLRALADTLPE